MLLISRLYHQPITLIFRSLQYSGLGGATVLSIYIGLHVVLMYVFSQSHITILDTIFIVYKVIDLLSPDVSFLPNPVLCIRISGLNK